MSRRRPPPQRSLDTSNESGNNNQSSSSSTSSTALDFGSAILDFFAGLIAFISGVFAGIASLFSALGWIIAATVIVALMIPWVSYHDEIIEEVEHAMRGVVYPAWRDVGVPVANFIRSIWNPLICWFNAFNWWSYGVIRTVLYPTAVECVNLKALFTTLSDFLLAVLKDFVVDYFFASGFYDGPADFTNICNKWILFWNEWTTMYSCFCSDLSVLLKSLPIVPSFFFSAQWGDPQTWCAISNLVNAAMEVFGILLKLVIQLLQAILFLIAPQSPFAALNFVRPNFYKASALVCESAICLSRSTENAIQRFWDQFIPFNFNFREFLTVLDVAVCFISKSINWILTVLINIDQVVLYPSNPFWEINMKPLTLENLNILAAPTQFDPVPIPALPFPQRFVITNYYLNTSFPYTPLGGANPMYQKKRMTDGICIVLTRIICDATGGFVPCFTGQTGNIFQGFDVCCTTTALGTLLVDVVSSVNQLSYHLVAQAGQDFFLFLDGQPFLTFFVSDLVTVAKCVLSFLRLIPVVGRAVESLIVELINYLLSTIRFIVQTVLGLATLPFFILAMDNTPNFITTTNKAQDAFVAIQERMVAMIPESFLNSLCIILNSGFGIPPIPCSSCTTGGFIPLPPIPIGGTKRRRTLIDPETGEVNSPWKLAAEAFGWKNPDTAYLVTPLLYYDSPSKGNLVTRMNPRDAIEKIMQNKNANIPGFSTHEEVDRFVDQKKSELLKRWSQVVTCADLKREEAELRETRPHIYRYNKQNGKYDCDETAERTKIKDIIRKEEQTQEERNTLGPTLPPVSSCSNPTPQCFDLCCLFRALTQTLMQLLSFVARSFNGFVQYEASRQGTVNDFPYFTGEFCEPQYNKPCFESDLVDTLLLFFRIPTCLCQVLNLVIPISPDYPRPDLCCGIQRIAEFIVCLLMVIINTVNSLIRGEYDYFRLGLFFNDVSALFDVAIEVGVCLCNLIRAVFPITYIPELQNSLSFDVCCIPLELFNAAIEVLRLFILTVISLATITITPSSYCFFRLDNDMTYSCSGTLDGIGLVQRLDTLINRFFPTSDVNVNPQTLSCSLTCAQSGAMGAADQGIGSIVPCACQIFNTLIPWRQNPGQKVSCDATSPNCQNINLCCPLVKLGVASNSLFKFLSRALVAIWQPWPNGLPEFFINFVFCDETATQTPEQCGVRTDNAPDACAFSFNGVIQPACGCGTFTCGKTNIIIDQLTQLVSACLCEFVRLLDALIMVFFESLGTTWQNCFCGRGGILQSAADVVNVILKQSINSLRKSPLPCFWSPSGYSQLFVSSNPFGMPPPPPGPVPVGACTPGLDPTCECRWIKAPMSKVEDSWVYSVVGPVADALCRATGNLACILNGLFFINSNCLATGNLFLGSTVRWAFQAVFVVVSFIEGFIRQFTDPQSTCIGPDPTCFDSGGSNVPFQGIQSKPFAQLVVAFLSFPVDLLIGDRTVACSGICPNGIADNVATLCDCWKKSPATAATYACTLPNGFPGQCSVWEPGSFGGILDPDCNKLGLDVGPPLRNWLGCQIVAQPTSGNILGVLSLQGLNCVFGVGAVLPFCTNRDDYIMDQYALLVNIGLCTGLSQAECFRRYPSFDPTDDPISCNAYNLCRPDQLPDCSSAAVSDLEIGTFPTGPIDGIIMGLLRYINCAIPGNVLYPLIWFLSMLWQLLGAFIYFQVTLLFFILSLFSGKSGCECHNFVDTEQRDNLRKHSKVGGLCYPCEDTWAMCGPAATAGLDTVLFCEPHCPFMFGTNASDTGVVANAQATCIETLTQNLPERYFPDHFSSVPRSAQSVCDGSRIAGVPNNFCNLIGRPTDSTCRASIYAWQILQKYQADCMPVHCQVGGSGIVPNAGYTRSDRTGTTYPALPLVDCFIKLIFDGFGAVIQAFVAIFTTPLIAPAAYKRDHARITNFTESRSDFWKRTGINQHLRKNVAKEENGPSITFFEQISRAVERGLDYTSLDSILSAPDDVLPRHLRVVYSRKRDGAPKEEIDRLIEEAERYVALTHSGFHPDQPSTPELMLMALYEYDTADCFTDPVACVCRNFHMEHYCTWTPEQGVIPNPSRKRRMMGRDWDQRNKTRYARDDVMYPEEVMTALTESFVDATECDHNIKMCSMMSYDTIDSTSMESWVRCVDKRIQGERLRDVSSGIITPNIMYYTQAPLIIFRNIIESAKASAETSRKRMEEIRKAERRQTHNDFEPDFWRTMEDRAKVGRKVLVDIYKVDPTSPIIEGIIQMDHIMYKYQTGYYHKIVERAWNSVSGFQFPTPAESFLELHEASTQLANVFRRMHFREAITDAAKQTRIVYGWARDVLINQGPVTYAYSVIDSYKARRDAYIEETKEKRAALRQAWNEMPLVKYWRTPSTSRYGNGTKRFYTIFDHLSNVIQTKRSERSLEEEEFNFWSADLRIRNAITHISTPVWTPEKLDNWNSLGRVAYKIYDVIYPGEERFASKVFINGNCKVVDRTLDLTLRLVDYCANEYMPNVNFTRNAAIPAYLRETSPKRVGTFHNAQNMAKYKLERTIPHDELSWIRPKFNGSYWEANTRHTRKYGHVSPRVYKRSIEVSTGPAGFNFYAWFISVIETIFNFMFSANTSAWFEDAKAWIRNPNTDESDYPDVGLRYWLLYIFFRCTWPEALNCSKGIGLPYAFLWVSVGILGALALGSLVFPPFTWFFGFISAWIVWAVLIGIIGFGWSPSCIFLFPSLTGISFALPMCLMDELKNFFDIILRSCYSPVPIPASMIAGDVCPVDPAAYIDFINCAIVGVSDGVQNILFLGTVTFGSWFYDITLLLAQSTVGLIIPGLNEYMRTTLDGFRYANPTQLERQWICFGLTAPSMVIILLGFTLVFIAFGFIIPLFILLLMKIWYVITTSPAGTVLPGGDDNAWDETFEEEDERRGPQDEGDQEEEATLEDIQAWIQERKNK